MPSLGSVINKFKKSGDKPWSTLKTSLQALETSANVFPPLQSAFGGLVACLESVQTAAANRQDYEEMANDLNMVAEMLKQYVGELSLEDCDGSVAYIARRIEDQVARIRKQQGNGMAKRVIESTQDREDIVRSYRQIEVLFRQLQSDISIRTWIDGDKQLVATLLRAMGPSDDARYNSSYSTTIRRHGCTLETREAVRTTIQDWVLDPNATKVYWMSGMAGTGKTTIAYSLCEWLEHKKLLGASFFCSRVSASSRSVNRIVPTLAYQLARYSPAFRSALCKTLKDDPDVSTLDVVQQFKKLIQEPAMVARVATPDCMVVVIDALDECEDVHSMRLMLDVILRLAGNLALKFFVTSRPEPVIADKFTSTGEDMPSILHLHDIEQSIVEQDIKKYLQETLSVVLPPVSEQQIDQLTKQSGKLFIYAATIARYIIPGDLYVDSDARLQAVLALDSGLLYQGLPSKQYDELNRLYTAILTAVFDERLELTETENRRLVLWTVICAREPLTYSALSSLLCISERRVSTAVHTLRSVLFVSGASELVSTFHASFPDYMFDQLRSNQFACNEMQHNHFLANRCFEVMRDQLRFNICGLDSSFVSDWRVPDLSERVEKCISHGLFYACRYWGEHMRLSDYANDLHDQLVDFLSLRLLFWMEVLNLRQQIGLGRSILSQAQAWLLKPDAHEIDTHTYVIDARNFVAYFAANACSRSTPHLYISALPFFSRTTTVYRKYWSRTRGLIDAQGTALERRGSTAIAAWKTDSIIKKIALSRDGAMIVLGSSHGAIWTRDAHTGAVISGPFEGHTGVVNSVSFSPSGKLVSSGSSDRTVRIWDLHTSDAPTKVLVGHTDSVNSVAFSSDGAHIVSGSSDRTIRVWGTRSGTLAFKPLIEHTGPVNSVGFSPDCTLIVSGSDDYSIRLWDVNTCNTVARVLQGHTDCVLSVSFSPDGTQVVSGSEDQSIRVWDVRTGAIAAGPFVGHQEAVNSVAFSPGGARIASGSNDCSIRVWDTLTGQTFAGPFSIHRGMVQSVTFSPDETRLISCSDDKTIRLWDIPSCSVDYTLSSADADQFMVESLAISPDSTRIVNGTWSGALYLWDASTGAKLFGPFDAHTDQVNSLAFSPDGLCFASGSNDLTIRMWNAQTGTAISEPFQGHTGAVNSVKFSPDGAHIASGSVDSTIRLWPSHDGAASVTTFRQHKTPVHSVAFSPDGTRIASASHDRAIRIWNVQTDETISGSLEGRSRRITSIVFSSSGAFVATSHWDCTIILWDALTGAIVAEPLEGSYSPVLSIAFSHDDMYIVSGSGGMGSKWPRDYGVRIWDLSARSVAEEFHTHSEPVHTVEVSSDGTCIVSGSCRHIRLISAHQHVNPYNISTSNWMLEGDGWVTADDALLFWVPRDMHSFLPRPRDTLVISSQGSLSIDYKNLLLGESLRRRVVALIVGLIILITVSLYYRYQIQNALSYASRPLWDTPEGPTNLLPHYYALGLEPSPEICKLHGVEPRSGDPEVWDAVLFSTELDLLEIRMNELDRVVDRFLIVESDRTFTGIPKPPILQGALQTSQFARFLPKITYRLHPGRIPNPGESPFAVEAEQRNAMSTLIRSTLSPEKAAPLVIMSDVDEIPAAHTIELIKKCAFGRELHLQLRNYVYSFEWPTGWRSWRAQVQEWGDKSFYRHSMAGDDILADAGWHCSFCFKTIEEFVTKMRGYSHADRIGGDMSLLDPAKIQDRICTGKDIFNMLPEAYTFKELFELMNPEP